MWTRRSTVLDTALSFARREYARLDAEIDAQRASADEAWTLAEQAARKCDRLATENAWLRQLLATHGITTEETDRG